MRGLSKKKRVLTGKHFMLGNYAVVEGALAAGCDFFAGYPITPANEISERMAARMPEVGGMFLQGDAAAIGGNHFIQAARRNLDVTMIVVNNLAFGMTGGQVAPTTPQRLRTMTTHQNVMRAEQAAENLALQGR